MEVELNNSFTIDRSIWIDIKDTDVIRTLLMGKFDLTGDWR